jgi:hypothetical protein
MTLCQRDRLIDLAVWAAALLVVSLAAVALQVRASRARRPEGARAGDRIVVRPTGATRLLLPLYGGVVMPLLLLGAPVPLAPELLRRLVGAFAAVGLIGLLAGRQRVWVSPEGLERRSFLGSRRARWEEIDRIRLHPPLPFTGRHPLIAFGRSARAVVVLSGGWEGAGDLAALALRHLRTEVLDEHPPSRVLLERLAAELPAREGVSTPPAAGAPPPAPGPGAS